MRALACISIFAAALSCFSQGTVNFANGAGGVNAPFCDANGVLLSGSGYLAQLYVGPSGTSNPLLLTTNGVSGTPTPFATGASAGYFFGNVRSIAGYTAATVVTLQVRVWATAAGTSWETAPTARGESNLIQVALDGGVTPVPNMVGLQGACLVPEPSSAVLSVLGFIAVIVFRTRRRTR
jgi:hypothetical protein